MAVWGLAHGPLGQALAVASEQAIRGDAYRERAAGDPEPPAAARDEPPASCAANNPPVAYRRALNSHATPKTGTDEANVAEPCIAFLDPVSVGAINPVNVGRSARRPGIPVVRTEAPFPYPSVEKARVTCRAFRHRTRGLRSIRVRPTTSAEQAHKHSDLCPPRHIPIVGRSIPRPHRQKDGFASRTRACPRPVHRAGCAVLPDRGASRALQRVSARNESRRLRHADSADRLRRRGWVAYLTTDEDEPAEAVVYCPECAYREFGARDTQKSPTGHAPSTRAPGQELKLSAAAADDLTRNVAA